MRRIVLHIGRQKTGTTAIQRFLRRNTTLLDSHNIYYPNYGINGFGQHGIGAPISHLKVPKYRHRHRHRHSDVVEAIRCDLLDEIKDINSLIVISSESFQNCDPRLVSQLFKGFQVEVVVYIREQVGFLASAYAQRVQASDYCGSLEEFILASMSSNYKKFIESWRREFPKRMTVKVYERNELLQGDVVVDFCESILGLCGDEVKSLKTQTDANPTLTNDLLEFKLLINKNCALNSQQEKKLYYGLVELSATDSSGKINIPNYLVDKITNNYEKTNRIVAKKYFDRDVLFKKDQQPHKVEPCSKLESRLIEIRGKLISLHPNLSEPLTALSL